MPPLSVFLASVDATQKAVFTVIHPESKLNVDNCYSDQARKLLWASLTRDFCVFRLHRFIAQTQDSMTL